jgi:hypothetical protein
MLGIVVLADLLGAAADLAQLAVAQDMLAGELVTLERLREIDDQIGVSGTLQLGAYLLAVIAFLLWYARAYRNGIALGARPPRYGTRWAVAYWFIPFVNLVRPKQVMNDIWRGSDPEMPAEDPGFFKRAVTPMLTFWWAGLLIASLAGRIAWNFDVENAKGLEGQAQIYLFSDLLDIAAAILAATIVWKATERQQERWRRWQNGQLPGQAFSAGPATAGVPGPASKSVPPPGYS